MARPPVENTLKGQALLAATGVLLVLLAVIGLLWYLSYGVNGTPPARLAVERLEHPTEIQWHENGAPVIEASSEKAFFASLGFVHGQKRGWSAVLWRQTALGRLSEWFGEETLELDKHARLLGFGRKAREHYAELPEGDRALLKAYASGLNAALSQRSVQAGQELALLHVEPAEWEPWHALAIERLMAWLTTPPLTLDDAPGVVERLPDRPRIEREDVDASPVFTTPPTAFISFLERDEALRQWLHLFGFEHSLAWAARDEQGLHLYQRHTYGRSALPLFQDVVWQRPDDSRHALASIPGTVMLPTGQGSGHAWSVLLSSRAALAWHPAPDSPTPHPEPIDTREGNEHVLQTQRAGNGATLLLPESEEMPDSLLSLSWSNEQGGGDISAWRDLLAGQEPSFQLLDGHGLFIDTTMSVLGAPTFQNEVAEGIFISNGPWGEAAAAGWRHRLEQDSVIAPAAWRGDTFSHWAFQTTTALVELMETQPFTSEAAAEALTYLYNWNHAYAPNSIAATIFDRWSARHQAVHGTPPGPELNEASWLERESYHRLLEETITSLRAEYGEDPSRWRWQDVMEQQRTYPVWSEDSLVSMAGSRHFPAQVLPGTHHPSTASWGPSVLYDGLTLSASWEGWLLLGEDNTFESRQHGLRPQGLRARLLWMPPSSETHRLPPAAHPNHLTTLTPTN